MSGGFQYLAGGPFQDPNDLMVDDVLRALATHVNVGRHDRISARCGASPASSSPASSRACSPISSALQDKYSATGQISIIYVKARRSGQYHGR